MSTEALIRALKLPTSTEILDVSTSHEHGYPEIRVLIDEPALPAVELAEAQTPPQYAPRYEHHPERREWIWGDPV